MEQQRYPTAIERRIQPKFQSRNAVTIADLRMAVGAMPPMHPRMVVQRKAAEISTAMAQIHGGEWRFQIDHQRRSILIWSLD